MPNRDKLLALAERVEVATGPSGAMDREIAAAINLTTENEAGQTIYRTGLRAGSFHPKRYTASLDAAMTLLVGCRDRFPLFALEHDEGGGALWTARLDSYGDECGHGETILCEGNTPALALTAAALRARAAQEASHDG